MRGARAMLALLAFVFVSGADAQTPSEAARAAWGFDHSDLTPHPGVRFGVFANGMRYALMPAKATGLSVRLRIGAGSAVEAPREEGFMHLVEHLIFQGSANLPPGALQLMLSHQGMKRWSDFSAFTSFDQTVYSLDLPRADARSRQTALTVMREIATGLSFERRPVEAARTSVIEELATRDTLADRILAAQNAYFLPGRPIADQGVAGTRSSIGRAGGAALRRLYERHYTPGAATLVMVGDFDPAIVEAESAARFADWPRSPPAVIDPAPPVRPQRRRAPPNVFVDPAAETVVTAARVQPLGSLDAGPRRDQLFLEHLGAEMLNRRFARIAASADAPFVRVVAAVYDHFSAARLSRIDITARNGNWQAAMKAGAWELRRALEGGFSQAELDEQLAESRRGLAAGPRTSPALADKIVDSVGRRIVFTMPTDVAATEAYLGRVRLQELNTAFGKTWLADGWLIFLAHKRGVPNIDEASAATWTTALRPSQPQELSPASAGEPASGRNRRETP